jgi:hypothetical protein
MSRRASVERAENSRHARLACIPDLRFDGLVVDCQRPGGKLYTNGRLGIQVELVPGKPRQNCSDETFETYGLYDHKGRLNVRFLLTGL